ncbi:cysteine proteinase [Parathielavia appendiculata]|uniref:ubiquitinyl hydrolase 1 n=1 Tax=Parathielavia appendiculata TaxID=2587402 RepID=A0AAN6Z4S3_9PEZI|nr:cysteine proteinase [Parathielavia appendiculata]
MAEDQNAITPTEETGDVALTNGENGSPTGLRRSGRVRNLKRPSDPSEDADYTDGPSTNSPAPRSSRRESKRRASPEAFEVPENLLEASLGPWKENEQSEWASWVELESDPAFFTAILGLLGVMGARIEEVLSVDEDSLAALPPPVYGLVFLFEYAGALSVDAESGNQEVWFANQTTSNACATIALLNIIMNAEGLALGEKLRKFEEETRDLSPPLRGHMIDHSTWIRVAHNSFSRRLDHLNAALALQNEVDSKKKRVKAAGRQSKKKPKRQTSTTERSGGSSAYHFIAYVPVNRKVWQLDGLKSAPVCIGEFEGDQHWTSVVQPVLQQKMQRHQTSFSLLALCGDNLTDVRKERAANIRRLAELEAKFGGDDSNWQPKADPDIICSAIDSRLETYLLNAQDIEAVPESEVILPEATESAADEREELGEEHKRLRAQYEDVIRMAGQETSAVLGRTKDYTPAIHEWVKKLADHSALKRLHEEVQLQNAH